MAALLVTWITASGCGTGSDTDGAGDTEPPAEPERAALAGLWPYEPEQVADQALIYGVLVIEEPCVYVELTRDGEIARTVEGEPVRSFVRLPISRTRFDPATNQIWVNDIGPMTSGDEVEFGGGISESRPPTKKTYEGVCVAHAETGAASMRPWPWVPRKEALKTPA